MASSNVLRGNVVGVSNPPGPGNTIAVGSALGVGKGNTLGDRQTQERERIEAMRRREDEAKNQQKVMSLETEKNRLESEVQG